MEFYYLVAAVNEGGHGEYTPSGDVTPSKTISRPGPVTLGEIEATTEAVTLSWQAPIDDGGSPVTGYVIYRGGSEEALEEVAEVGPTAVNWTDGVVEQGKTYWYTVVPRNAVGDGDPATAREVVVPKDEKERDESPGMGAVAALVAITVALLSLGRGRRRP
jgi:hypothetical protein